MNEETPSILIDRAFVELGVPPCLLPLWNGQWRRRRNMRKWKWRNMRKLPEDPVKRRTQQIKRIYQHLEHFRALLEAGVMEMPGIVTIPDTGEEIYLGDLMVGIESLPPQQRRAFDLICLAAWTETDATREILPDSKWSTPVQQYADTALARMIAAYDHYEETGEKPEPYRDRRRKSAQGSVSEEEKIS